nr:acidic proline-rich protein PRP25-like [Paramormyrops kingsleyae]
MYVGYLALGPPDDRESPDGSRTQPPHSGHVPGPPPPDGCAPTQGRQGGRHRAPPTGEHEAGTPRPQAAARRPPPGGRPRRHGQSADPGPPAHPAGAPPALGRPAPPQDPHQTVVHSDKNTNDPLQI